MDLLAASYQCLVRRRGAVRLFDVNRAVGVVQCFLVLVQHNRLRAVRLSAGPRATKVTDPFDRPSTNLEFSRFSFVDPADGRVVPVSLLFPICPCYFPCIMHALPCCTRASALHHVIV